MSKRTNECVIIIPTFNEKENIEQLISDILALDVFDILVVDDSSPDGTGLLVSEIAQQDERVRLLTRKEKNGIGPAYTHGFRHVLRENYNYIIQMDADFSHQPRYLLPMYECAKQGNDLVIGSRYVEGGGVRNWSYVRRLISRGGSLYAMSVLGLPIKDCTGGFKCWRASFLPRLLNAPVQASGYMFQIEMNHRAQQHGARIHEMPIIFPDREKGQSKMTPDIVFEAATSVLKLRYSQFMTGFEMQAKNWSEGWK